MTADNLQPSVDVFSKTVAAGEMPPWQIDELIPPPARHQRSFVGILGPGILLAGGAIGAGEWLFGPAVTAQYGGTLLWLATISIVVQVFYNVEVMRYALYCGEPIFIGFFRTWPGPSLWTLCYITLFFGQIWPFMASNAAVPLAAAVLGHLPGEGVVSVLGMDMSESLLVKILGFVIFFAAFVPLVFGGKVYTVLERVMAFKLVVVLGFLVIVVAALVSWNNIGEILTGFVRFGTVPLRAQTVISGPNFAIAERRAATTYLLQGSIENDAPAITGFMVERNGVKHQYGGAADVPFDDLAVRKALMERATNLALPGEFYVESIEDQQSIIVRGVIGRDGMWQSGRGRGYRPWRARGIRCAQRATGTCPGHGRSARR